jgi:hypothetical protein
MSFTLIQKTRIGFDENYSLKINFHHNYRLKSDYRAPWVGEHPRQVKVSRLGVSDVLIFFEVLCGVGDYALDPAWCVASVFGPAYKLCSVSPTWPPEYAFASAGMDVFYDHHKNIHNSQNIRHIRKKEIFEIFTLVLLEGVSSTSNRSVSTHRSKIHSFVTSKAGYLSQYFATELHEIYYFDASR